MELEVFRGDDIVAVIETGGKNARFTHGLMNAHKIVVTDIKQYDALQVQIEDYIVRKGIKYKINTVPDLNADDQLSYNITFEGPKYTWHDKLFMDEGEAEFTYYGNALLCMQLFITNINEVDPIWILAEIADTTEKHIVFSNVTCHEAILIIAEAFGLEFQEIDKTLTMIQKIGRDTGLNFEYGMGKGLYNLTRTYVSDKNVVTKVYGFGGSRNIPVGYRGTKKRLTFDPGFHTNNTELYGIKEGQYTDDSIIPEREAAVTGVTHGNPLSTITDATLDFNVKDCVIEGLEPKIGFTSGTLAGEEFVITDYNPTTKTITFKGFVNDNNIVLPNDTFRAEVGDKYVFYDIELPATYVTAGETKVDTGSLQYLMENSVPKVEYGGTIDPINMRDNAIELFPGDRVNFKDARIGLDATIRITEISMPLDFPEVISDETTIDITIANFVTYTAQQRLRDEKLIQRHEIKTIDLRSVEQARRNSANLLNLRDSVIDPEGNYYTEKIKPGSVETLFLSVGAKATNFNINGVSFQPNVGGNPNSFAATVGQLIHYDLELPGGGFVWEMQPYAITGLVPANKYYLYAKISKVTNVGSWELSTEVKLAESLAGFYILQAGVLFPVKDGRRDNAITKGMVFIVGDQITAGRIQSIDQAMFIDLTTGQMKLGNDQHGMDWNVTTPNRLTIRGGITQNSGGISAPVTLFRGAYGVGSTYYPNDTVTYNGSTWIYVYPTPISGITPTQGQYWNVLAAKGIDGDEGSTVEIQYSIDGATLWHSTFTSGDIFMRQRVGTGAWSSPIRIVGEDGDPGEDGKYTSYQFAKNESLTVAPTTGFTDAPPSVIVGEYLWLRTGEFSSAGQNGTWSTAVRISGADGPPGTAGNYTEFRFAKNGSATTPPELTATDPNPAGWTIEQPTLSAAEYGWITSSVKTSAGALIANWSTPTRFTGLKGSDGTPGSQGPFMNYRGDYDAGKTYVGTSTRIEAVKYEADYYVTRVDAGTISPGTLPTDASKFNPFGGQFESVATGLLLAELAYIKNLMVENLKTNDTGKRIEILNDDNNIKLINDNEKEIIVLDDDSAVVSSFENTTPPVLNPDGSYPKNYLGSRTQGGTTYYVYATMGPGISVGIGPLDANGVLTLGTKGVNSITNGSGISYMSFIHNGLSVTSSSRTGFYTNGEVRCRQLDVLERIRVSKVVNGIDTYMDGITKRVIIPTGTTGLIFYMDFIDGILVEHGGPIQG